MYPQECFAYYKRPFWPVLCLKRIGLPCCTFVITIVTSSLQIILLSNYSVTYNFSTCRYYLTENYLSFPSAPHWVQHSYLSKRATIDPLYLWVITVTCYAAGKNYKDDVSSGSNSLANQDPGLRHCYDVVT